jgi:hypothetical protein
VAHNALPPLFSDVSTRAYDAIDRLLPEYGGRCGSLIVAEAVIDHLIRKRKEREAAGIVETPVDEDEQLVAANPELLSSDSILGSLVTQARKRLAGRKAAAEQST